MLYAGVGVRADTAEFLRCDPLKLLIQFLTDKEMRPVDLFRAYDKEKQYRVTREQFIQGLKKAKVPLDDYEIEKVISRLDASGKEGKISYQRLMRGVKDQIKMNRAEETQKLLQEKSTAAEDHRNIHTTGLQQVASAARASFVSSRRSTPSPTAERPSSASTIDTSTVKSTLGGKSAGNGTESKVSFASQSSSKVNGMDDDKAKDGETAI